MNSQEQINYKVSKEQKRQSKEICQIRQKFCKDLTWGFLGDCSPCKN